MVVKRPRPNFSIETQFRGLICGIDEAGRGSLAGPVVAAAVILDQDRTPDGITDSKLLTQVKREHLFRKITTQAAIAVGFSEVEEIDKINILNATLAAMGRAVDNLTPAPAVALVDGNHSPKLDCSAHTVIGGDRLSLSIAAASIAGYGTSEHLAALASHGVTPHHRRSFAPVVRASRSTN
ncbi:MAG TPA: ribonuclease HII [Alphaproteobacteria bacterium]|nr:ribonuclease HII [Alphaproteobacteria bacterium]